MAQQISGMRGTDSVDFKNALEFGVEITPFTNVTVSGTTTATTGTATANGGAGLITTQSLATTAGAVYALTVTNNVVTTGDIVWAQVGNGTNTTGQPNLASVTSAPGAFTCVIQNIHGSSAFGGTLVVGYEVLKAAPAQL